MGEELNRPIWCCYAHPIAMHVIIIVIITLGMTCTTRASNGQFKINLDIRGFGGTLRVIIAHLVHSVYCGLDLGFRVIMIVNMYFTYQSLILREAFSLWMMRFMHLGVQIGLKLMLYLKLNWM